MSRLVTARASATTAKVHLDELGRKLAALASREGTPPEVAEQLTAILVDLLARVRIGISGAERELIQLAAEDLGADARKAVAGLQGLVSAARVVSRADVAAADESVRASLESFAIAVGTGEVPLLDRAALSAQIQAFQADIERQAALGDRVSRVVATVVGIGRTAVRLLA